MPFLSAIAPFGFDDLPTALILDFCHQLGCRGSQFYRNRDNPPDPGEARQRAEDCGLPFNSIHGLFGSDLDPSSPDPKLRRQTIATYEREADLALQVGGPAVVVHPSPMVEQSGGDSHSSTQRRDALLQSLEELADIGESMNVVFLIENVPPDYPIGSNPIDLGSLVGKLNHPSIRVCFDTGHANMCGDPTKSLVRCSDFIGGCHLHDNDGITDAHLPPGEGTCEWGKLGAQLATLGDQVPLALEFFVTVQRFRDMVETDYGQRLAAWLKLPHPPNQV